MNRRGFFDFIGKAAVAAAAVKAVEKLPEVPPIVSAPPTPVADMIANGTAPTPAPLPEVTTASVWQVDFTPKHLAYPIWKRTLASNPNLSTLSTSVEFRGNMLSTSPYWGGDA